MGNSERLTIMLNSDLAKKIRAIQSKQIKETNKTVSFSSVVNDILIKGLAK